MSSIAASITVAMRLMHRVRIIALDEERRPSATAQELAQFLTLDAREHGRIADLVDKCR